MTTIPLPVDAVTDEEAADALVSLHDEGCIDLHAIGVETIETWVTQVLGGFERDHTDAADDARDDREQR